MEGARMNPNIKIKEKEDRPQPNFVLTHTDGREVIYHPGSTKQGLLAFREVGGQLRLEALKREHRKQAFQLAAGRYLKEEDIQKFERFRAPSDDEFEIGSDVWSWVLSPQLERDFRAWLGKPHPRPATQQQASEPVVPEDQQIHLNPEEVDVQILRADTGEDLGVEEGLKRIKMRLDGQLATQVKPEPPEEKSLRVKDIYYTQDKCSAKFQGGPYMTLQDCLDALIAKQIDPENEAWMTLRVIKDVRRHKLVSVDNRRLWCLKKYQQYLDQHEPGKIVWVKVKLHTWTETHKRYLEHNDTTCDGETIQVRQKCR
eukprot:Skav215929  [mRNA]  locus=scaffold226:310853:312255:+ [translate_table: standard]